MLELKGSRARILDFAAVAVEKASSDGGMIAAHTLAARLLEQHPDCPMTLEELSNEIARMAVDRGVGVEFGPVPGEGR